MTSGQRQGRSRRKGIDAERSRPAVDRAAEDKKSARTMWGMAIALAAVTVVVFAPVGGHPFITFDDPGYVTDNPRVKRGLTLDAIKWAMTSGYFANWHPLTWLSHMLDVELFGVNAGPHHVVNLVFHVANVLLLFALLYRMTRQAGRSAFVAALFAIHPMHVESVAWVSERKDVLSTLFWILTTLAYVEFVRQRSIARYALVIVLYALGLMSKPMLVTLPFTLLLLDVWPLRRVTFGVDRLSAWLRLVVEKLPLFTLAVASSAITVIVQRDAGAMQNLTRLPIVTRVMNATIAYAMYVEKLVWPAKLAILYPYPRSIALVTLAASVVILGVISAIAVRAWRNHPYLLVGWLWFLGTLVPVIGLVQVGAQSMADRYSYVPAIGVFVMVAWGVPELVRRFAAANIAVPLFAGLVVAAFAAAARNQVGYWQTSSGIWTRTIEVTENNYLAENNLGWDFALNKKFADAIPHYVAATKIDPSFIGAHTNLALALVEQGRFDEAIAEYNAALRLEPNNPLVHANLGIALARQGKPGEAIPHYLEAIRLNPKYAEAHSALGLALTRLGRVDEAITHYNEALDLDPKLAEAHSNLGTALASQGKVDSAAVHFAEAVRLKPDYVDAHNNLGVALASQGKLDEAIAHFSEAARLNPGFSAPHYGLGSVYQTRGRIDEAVREFNEALRLNPNNADARRALDALRSLRK